MIAIINNGILDDDIDGNHKYRVQINNTLICEFEHVRSHGLATCLRMAADAVDKHEDAKIVWLCDQFKREELK